jgi:hypothetical protein
MLLLTATDGNYAHRTEELPATEPSMEPSEEPTYSFIMWAVVPDMMMTDD